MTITDVVHSFTLSLKYEKGIFCQYSVDQAGTLFEEIYKINSRLIGSKKMKYYNMCEKLNGCSKYQEETSSIKTKLCLQKIYFS